MGEICVDCPFAALLDGADEIAMEIPQQNDNQLKAQGGIFLTRQCLEKAAQNVACPKPSGEPHINPQNGQVDCPLREVTYGIRTMGVGVWSASQFGPALDKVATQADALEHEQTSPGQYL